MESGLVEDLLYFWNPLLFFSAILLDLLNRVFSVVGKEKRISHVLCVPIGNEVDQKAMVSELQKFMIRYYPLALLALGQSIGEFFGIGLVAEKAFRLSSFVVLFILNFNVPGLNLNCLGVISNMVACLANGGKMPALYPSLDINKQLMDPAETNFKFLTDWIIYDFTQISIGDILIAIGALIFFVYQLQIFSKMLILRSGLTIRSY